MTPDALRDVLITCIQTACCHLCARPLDGEAYWIDAAYCADCARVHADPWAPRCHAVWVPAARVALETDVPDVGENP